jgi:hypothetical protein
VRGRSAGERLRLAERAALLAAAVVFCLPALWNGYPIVYDDTGAHLGSGLRLSVPADRPVHYGLFLRLASLLGSAWWAVLAQGLALAALLAVAFRSVAGARRPALAALGASCALALATGAGVHASYLIPDVFAAVVILGMALLLAAPDLTRVEVALASALVLLGACTHLSHLPLAIALAALGAAWRWLAPPSAPAPARARLALALAAAAPLLVAAVHASLGGGFHLARAWPAFAVARMAEDGLLARVLDARCAEARWRLCAHRGALPLPAWRFVWDRSSPFYATGGFAQTNLRELSRVAAASLGSPELAARQLASALEGGARQLLTFDAGTWASPMTAEEPVLAELRRAFPREVEAYLASRQSRGALRFAALNRAQRATVPLAALFLAAAVALRAARARLRPGAAPFAALLLAGAAANAFATGGLIGPLDRYQSRVAWLLPAGALIVAAALRFRPAPPGYAQGQRSPLAASPPRP